MNRNGALIALAVAVVTGVVFAIYPEFDLAITASFYNPETGRWSLDQVLEWRVRRGASWLITLIVAPAFLSLAAKLAWPHLRVLLPGRAALLMVVTLAVGPGLVANVILKDNWGRPRPIEIPQFRGNEQFRPWWDPRGTCPKNCSFVAGEPSGAFWTLAPAALVPAPWRAVAYGAALAFGVTMGVVRISAGGHFFSDVVFAGVFMFLVIWLVHGLIYRWRATRFEDAAIERLLGNERMRWRRFFGWIADRIRRGRAGT